MKLENIGRLKRDHWDRLTFIWATKFQKLFSEMRVRAWSFSSSQYVQEAVKNVELHLRKTNEK